MIKIRRIYRTIVLIFVTSLVFSSVLGGVARATSFDWVNGAISIEKLSGQGQGVGISKLPGCEMMYVLLAPDATIPTQMCVMKGDTFSLAVSYQTNTVYVRYTTDRYFYKITNMRTDYYDGYYLRPGTDQVIVFKYDQSVGAHHIYQFNDFSNVLIRNRIGNEYNYSYDRTAYQHVVGDIPAQPVNVVQLSAGFSPSGQYMVVSVGEAGTFRYNLDTYDVKSFTKTAPRQYDGADYRWTITDDGQYSFLAGRNVPISVYNIDADCGRSALPDTKSIPECPSRDVTNYIKDTLSIPDMYNQAIRAQIISSNEVQFSRTYGDRAVLLSEGYVKPALEYLALGDSYSSGEGDVEKKDEISSYYLPMTDVGVNTCHVSSRSYPFLIRAKERIEVDKMKSVACSGAKVTQDYYGPINAYLGQNERLIERGTADIPGAREIALKRFIPGWVPQIEFVKKYKPRVITFTGGGNDVGFAGILAYCASSIASCGYTHKDGDERKVLYHSIDTQYPVIKQFIEQIKNASPDTRIILVGYPSFISEDLFCTVNSALLDIDEKKMINEAVHYLNEMLKRVANDESIQYADIENSLVGGRMCEGSEYVTGLFDVNAYNTVMGMPDHNLFHPNTLGHIQIANTIEQSHVFNQDETPLMSSYTTPTTQNMTIQTELVQDGSILQTRQTTDVSTNKMTFTSSSNVSLSGYSDKVDLGTYVVDSDGSLHAAVDFSKLSPGRHLIVLTGISPSGEILTLYQFVTVKVTDQDEDGDGVLDTEDSCQFVTQWYDETTGQDVCIYEVQSTAVNETHKSAPVGTKHTQPVLSEKHTTDNLGINAPYYSQDTSETSVYASKGGQSVICSSIQSHTYSTGSLGRDRTSLSLELIIIVLLVIGGIYGYAKKRQS